MERVISSACRYLASEDLQARPHEDEPPPGGRAEPPKAPGERELAGHGPVLAAAIVYLNQAIGADTILFEDRLPRTATKAADRGPPRALMDGGITVR